MDPTCQRHRAGHSRSSVRTLTYCRLRWHGGPFKVCHGNQCLGYHKVSFGEVWQVAMIWMLRCQIVLAEEKVLIILQSRQLFEAFKPFSIFQKAVRKQLSQQEFKSQAQLLHPSLRGSCCIAQLGCRSLSLQVSMKTCFVSVKQHGTSKECPSLCWSYRPHRWPPSISHRIRCL